MAAPAPAPAPGPVHLLELCDQKLLDFVCNLDNKDLVWLWEIKEEAERMFTREFSKEPELMPKTPSQKNRRRKRRISNIQDENKDPIRKRSSRRKTRSSQLASQHRPRSKGKGERPAPPGGDRSPPVLRRMTRAAAAAALASLASGSAAPSPTPGPAPVLTREPVVKIGIAEHLRAEQRLSQLVATLAPSQAASPAPAAQGSPPSHEEPTPTKPEASRPESVTVSSLVATPQDPKRRELGTGRSASKLKIARASPDSPWRERVLAPVLDNCSTPRGGPTNRRSVRRSLLGPSSPGTRVPLAEKYSLVTAQEGAGRRSSRRVTRKAAQEPAASARIICHSYLERLLNVEVPQRVGPEQGKPSLDTKPGETAEPEASEDRGGISLPHGATKVPVSPPHGKPLPRGPETPTVGPHGPRTDEADGCPEPPQSVRRKRSYKQAMCELDEEPSLGEDELQPPRSKTPSPPCPASKVVRPLRTFLHTVQRNQLLMTPTSAPRGAAMKSFIKRNTPLRMDPKEKERQRLESLRRKEEAEQRRRQKVQEDKRRRLEEVKLKREERLRKVLLARERMEQMQEEKKKQMDQKLAQMGEKTEKAREERLAEEKARKRATARKMEEAEARRRQEEEARRLRWLQQEEERRQQELLQKRKEEEERQRRAAEAREAQRLAEQREQEQRRAEAQLQAERELQEQEKAVRLQRELEEKKKAQEEQQRLQEEQKKAKVAAAERSQGLNVTIDVQSPACTSYQMTPQGHRAHPKNHPENYCNYGMDLNSDDSTDDEAHPRKPIPTWARGTALSQAIVHQYYHPPNLPELFGTILPLDLEDIFKKSKPRYHKRTSSAVWNSPPLQGPRAASSLAYSLKKY